jgi:cation diffusion facilitator CzcD-associated flavoprotein CzcO
MPLLEETGYMPKHKYSYGPELRAHAERIAEHWGLRERTIFRQQVTKMAWNTDQKEWVVKTEFVGDRRDLDLTLQIKYAILGGGQMTHPKVPDVEGLGKFQGHMFHTSRWDYAYTGGSTAEARSDMPHLKDKTVGIIGTGATAVQTVPELAKWAKQLYVIQRTPSSVDERNQRETDPEEWRSMTAQQGWWQSRNVNFSTHLHQKRPAPEANLVNDGWVVGNPSYCTAWGYDNALTAEQVPAYVQKLHAEDVPRAERIRKRVDETVKNKETAQSLKHWYPSWCKRPCFHDDYLPAFNQPNVTLVDTDGHGIDRFTEGGIVANGKEYALDLLILSTGYRVTFPGLSPAARYSISITGKDGRDMAGAFVEEIATLHGLVSRNFPNLFFSGMPQAALTANQIHNMDTYARHIVYMIMESQRQSGTSNPVIEPTKEAQDEWGDQVAVAALGMSGMAGCTPNYLNMEGELDKLLAQGPEVQAQMMRGQIWGKGINDYVEQLEKWQREGSLKGLVIMSGA